MPPSDAVNQDAERSGRGRVALLVAADGRLGMASELRGVHGLELVTAATTGDLVAMVLAGAAEAVALDPELGEGWPVDTAEQVTRSLRASVPVVIVCRSQEDAEQIEHRVGGGGTTSVVLGDRSSGHGLAASVKGLIAVHRARVERP